MIHKTDLVGKYIEFRDKDGKTRIGKVKRVSGNYISIIDAVKRRRRIHIDKVICQMHHGHVREEIDKGRKRRNKK